jgi:hypothetical protein
VSFSKASALFSPPVDQGHAALTSDREGCGRFAAGHLHDQLRIGVERDHPALDLGGAGRTG